MSTHRPRGFTLVELLVVVTLIVVLAGIIVAVLNPARRFALARNATRASHLTTILNGIAANAAEHEGVFVCASGPLPSVATRIRSGSEGYDLAPCLVTEYLASLPFDPSDAVAQWTSEADYDTGYVVSRDVDGRITLSAPSQEFGEIIFVTR